MENEKLGTGALPSKKDSRTIKHSDLVSASEPLIKGGFDYQPQDIEHQHCVGVCTAISMIQNREKANGKKYSPEFQYLLQKKFIDLNWSEGSAVFSALKVGKNYGFLPLELFTYANEQDRYLPYSQYIAKLQAIPDSEVQRLISLCVDKIAGYAQVDQTNTQSIAKAIIDSEAGVLCRYGCQQNWWEPSWLPKDIDPLRYAPETSGHAIGMYAFDYTEMLKQKLCNTWGTLWDWSGCANIIHSLYPPIEVWIILKTNPMYKFTTTMKLGSYGNEVKELQKRLKVFPVSGYFFTLTKRAVQNYQKSKGLIPDGIVGEKTRAELNK